MDKQREYAIKSVAEAKKVALIYLESTEVKETIDFGLPEFDDRYQIWRVPLLHKNNNLGEIVIDALTSLIKENKTIKISMLEKRIQQAKEKIKHKKNNTNPNISLIPNTIGLGDSYELLKKIPMESVDLIFTSPPYYNAKPEYSEYESYTSYLDTMRRIIQACHKVLNEGRFFVINISPILIRRSSRNESSKRIAVPFDFHKLFIEENFEFIDDIIWVKPEGAGWATGRGRRFSADRNPLQYKPVPVTEYLLVYRKKTEKLIDWHIRKHPNQELVEESKIKGNYEVTNIWKITPTHSKKHPAIFPVSLAEKVIQYYSFVDDVVLDPFSGIGTVGDAAHKLKRRYVLFELKEEYMEEIKQKAVKWSSGNLDKINWINTPPPSI